MLNMAFTITLLAVLLPCCTLAFSNRPPVDHGKLCIRMSPGRHHGNRTASGPAPFTIETESKTYTRGSPIQVIIRANQGTRFTGFLLQARRISGNVSMTEEALGTFSNVTAGTAPYFCTTKAGSWGQTSAADKMQVQASWMSSDDEGQIEFKATVVGEGMSRYWEGVKSSPLSHSGAPGGSSLSPVVMAAVVCLALMME